MVLNEGKELELMLSGRKKLAVFHDKLSSSRNIPEEIIPECLFSPYVQAERIVRFEQDMAVAKNGSVVRYVLYTLPGEEWRARAFLWIKQDILSGHRLYDDADDIMAGRLLGYTEHEIRTFMTRRKEVRR